jgi:hypothetical protein
MIRSQRQVVEMTAKQTLMQTEMEEIVAEKKGLEQVGIFTKF